MTSSLPNDSSLSNTRDKLLILSLAGIGNYLMHTPFIAEVKRQRPRWRISLWCAPRRQAELARANPNIDEVIEHPMQSPFLKDLPFIWRLNRFDCAVMLSPGQRLKGAAYLAAARIRSRIAHRYPLLHHSSSAWLTAAIAEKPRLHDIEQNLALLKPLGLNYPLQTIYYSLSVHPRWQAQASQLLSDLKVPPTKLLIGLHPGSDMSAQFKRWPLDRFTALSRALAAQHQAHILIFGGPGEENLKRHLREQLAATDSSRGRACSLITANLLTTAAVIQRCQLFIANDSGLMHLAAAVGTATLGLFGPTDEAQVGPRGPQSFTLRAAGTQPVYNTEKNWQLGVKPHTTLERLTTPPVIATAAQYLSHRPATR